MLGSVAVMVSRLTATTAQEVAAVWPRGRSSAAEGGEVRGETTDGSAVDLSPDLYQCGTCEQIYVAVDKETCRTCDTDVERVDVAD